MNPLLPGVRDNRTAEAAGAIRSRRTGKWRTVALILALSTVLASAADHAIAAWIGVREGGSAYRRIGPESGPQVFGAGSSLLQFGLSWPEVSQALGRGIENWGVPASSPEIWEISQAGATNTDLMLIGVSVYDLNEYHVAERRANFVRLAQTVRDLRDSKADWELSARLLNQYLFIYARLLFPTAGYTDKTHVGLRAKARAMLRLPSAAEDRDNELVLPSKPILQFGDSKTRVSNWDDARMLRRLALLRSENRGKHAFDGPKRLAFNRMLSTARSHGDIIIVVLPVTEAYAREFLTPEETAQFEESLSEARVIAPAVRIIRLDRVPGLMAHEYFSDLVHLNAAGREIATAAFLDAFKASAHSSRGNQKPAARSSE